MLNNVWRKDEVNINYQFGFFQRTPSPQKGMGACLSWIL